MKARYTLIAALAVALSPLKASAQAWVGNPDYEGAGIRAGNFELHWSAAAEFGYDSNYFRTSGEGPGEDVIDVLLLRLTPSFSLSTLGEQRRDTPTPQKVAFKLGAYAAYHEVIATDSDESGVSDQRNVGVGADAKLDLFPQGKAGFDMLAAYARTIDTDGNSADLAGEGFNRDTLRGGAGVTWRPGGGTFDWRAGYNLTYKFIEDDGFDYLTNVTHQINTRGRWRFLPRSALLFDASYGFTRYVEDVTTQNDGDTVTARIGYRGLVTYHLSLMGMLGWAASFYEPSSASVQPRQFDSLTVNAEARWYIQPRPDLEKATITSGLSSIALGYNRGFDNSYQGSYYQRDRGYLSANMFLLGALSGGLEFGVSRVYYPEAIDPNPQESVPAITQMRLDGRVFAEYRLTDIFAINTSFLYDKVTSSPGPAEVGEDLEYDRWQWYLGVRLFM